MSPSIDVCSSTGTQVTLNVTASDPDGDKLTYHYLVNEGVVGQQTSTAIWNLHSASLGKKTATVEVIDSRGGRAISVVAVGVKICGACDPPPCPPLNVSCPNDVPTGEKIKFIATATGAELTYDWQVTNGKIVKGQGSSMIEVDTTDSGESPVTAVVSVNGLPSYCSRTASCSCALQKRRSQ
jgi:hypothetical protein